MRIMTAVSVPNSSRADAVIPNPIVIFEIDGNIGRKALLEIIPVLTYESATPRDQIDVFRSLLEQDRPAALSIIGLSPVGSKELF